MLLLFDPLASCTWVFLCFFGPLWAGFGSLLAIAFQSCRVRIHPLVENSSFDETEKMGWVGFFDASAWRDEQLEIRRFGRMDSIFFKTTLLKL